MAQSKKIIFLLVSYFLFSCNIKNTNQDYVLNKFKIEINYYYSIKNTYSHFPHDITDTSIKQTYIVWPSQECISQVYVLQKTDYMGLSNIADNQSIKQSSAYLDSTNFIMTLDWLWDTTSIHHKHTDDQLSKLPIPDFIAVRFDTKEISYSEEIEGENIVFTRHTVPEDMIVHVIDAQSGCFWKNKAVTIRPSSLGRWEHGCSKGFAVSESLSIICF